LEVEVAAVGELLEDAVRAWAAADPASIAALSINYSTFANPFLHVAESAYFEAARGDGTSSTVIATAARMWLETHPNEPATPYSSPQNRFLWAAEVAFFEMFPGVIRPPEKPEVPGGRKKQQIPRDLRWEVWERDDFTCNLCGIRRRLSIDHIWPESKGGALDIDNLQTLCESCNSAKGTKTQ
jgi:hypothetical protein